MFAKGIAIDFLVAWSNWFGMLLGPTLLLVSIAVIMSSISVGDVGLIINVWEFGDFK